MPETERASPSRADQNRAALRLGRRSKTLSIGKLERSPAYARPADSVSVLLDLDDEDNAGPLPERPRTRGDCVDGPRPCPWVACKHHLYLDVDPVHGSIKFNWPDHEPWELRETCVLDVTGTPEHGTPRHLVTVGELMNLTRERIRQIEQRALRRLRENDSNELHEAADLAEVSTDGEQESWDHEAGDEDLVP